jgi:Ras family
MVFRDTHIYLHFINQTLKFLFSFHVCRFFVQTQCDFRRESCSCRDWNFGHMQCKLIFFLLYFAKKLSLRSLSRARQSNITIFIYFSFNLQNGCAYDDVIRWADSFLVIYSIVDRDSFHEAEKLLKQISKLKLPSYYTALLLGNKNDLEHSRYAESCCGPHSLSRRRRKKNNLINFHFENASRRPHNGHNILLIIVNLNFTADKTNEFFHLCFMQ